MPIHQSSFTITYAPSPEPSRLSTNPPSPKPSRLPTNQPTNPTNTPSNSPNTNPPSTLSPSISPFTRYPTESPTFLPSSANIFSRPTPIIQEDTPFVDDCTNYLLSPNGLDDGIVSDMEFAQFLSYHCIKRGLCNYGTAIAFEELDVGIQLEFVFGVCSHEEQTKKEKVQCIDDLEMMWTHGDQFGFHVNDYYLGGLTVDVRSMCINAYGYALEMGLTATPGKIL